MGILAYLAPDDIPLSLINSDVMSEIARGEAVAALCEVSLLEIKSDRDDVTVTVHRLAQTVMRDRLAKQHKEEHVSNQALILVAAAFPHGAIGPDDVRFWSICAALRPHVLSVLQTVRDKCLIAETAAILLTQLALYLVTRAEHGEAEALYRRAVELLEGSFGPSHTFVSTALNHLAALLRETNRLQEAEPLMRRALDIDEEALGPDHPDVGRDLSNLAWLLKDMWRLEEAEAVMGRALHIAEKHHGTDDSQVASRLIVLGRIHMAVGVLRKPNH